MIRVLEKLGESKVALGDQFGAINALFSGLAFVSLIFTLISQQREIDGSVAEGRN